MSPPFLSQAEELIATLSDFEQRLFTPQECDVMAEALARTSPPLLTLDPGNIADSRVLKGSVTLTDTGRAVLAGEQDRIGICGIDRWLGGVHLGSADLWRWDDKPGRITRV